MAKSPWRQKAGHREPVIYVTDFRAVRLHRICLDNAVLTCNLADAGATLGLIQTKSRSTSVTR
jgi:hypothetical protein